LQKVILNTKLVLFCVEQVNCLYNIPRLHLKKNILRLTAYFKLGENIESREGRGTRLKARNEKYEPLVQTLLISAYGRRRNYQFGW
jgi:hypothetical protein